MSKTQEIATLVAQKKEGVSFRAYGKQARIDEKPIGHAILSDMKEAVNDLNVRRQGSDKYAPEDLSFSEYAQERWGIPDLAALLNLAGIDPSKVTVEQLYALPDVPADARWIIPELFLEPIRTGFRRPALYADLIRDTLTVSTPTVTVPEIKMSDADMKRVGEGETIPLGTVEFGGKQGRVFKIGRGFRLTDEVVQFSTINLLSPFLEDLGVKMNMSQTALAIEILINGEAAANASSAAVIGVANTTTGFQYRDFLKAHARFERLGRTASVLLANEDTYVDVKDMPEVKGLVGTNQLLRIDADLRDLTAQNMKVHGKVPNNAVIFVDKQSALRRLLAKPLMVESERIVSKQVNVVYATAMLGFMTFLRDGRFIMRKDLAYSGNAFPAYMDPSPYENIEFGY